MTTNLRYGDIENCCEICSAPNSTTSSGDTTTASGCRDRIEEIYSSLSLPK